MCSSDLTLYDLDRHAARAQQLGVDLAPATFIRSGRSQVQYVGMASGTLLAAFMDAMSYVSVGRTPLDDASREVLAALERPVHVEILGAPYDAVSGHLMRLTAAMAAECRHVRPRIVDATEYPLFAARRQVTGVPVIVIEGQRFAGLWEEADLVEQIRRAAAGETEIGRAHV